MPLQMKPEISARMSPEELLRDLIRFNTTNPPGNEIVCVQYIRDLLTSAGFECVLFARDPNRPNLITRLGGRGMAPSLMFYGHVDVVTAAKQGWTYDPFEGRIADGCVWGRGSLDMKGPVAMMITSLLRAKAEGVTPQGDVVLAILSDEEAGGDYGARFLVSKHAERFEGVRYAVGEFGGFSMPLGGKYFYPIQVAEKQVCWMKAVVRGPGGHGSRPLKGGAMAKLGRLLTRLDSHRFPARVTPVPKMMIETIADHLPFPSGAVLRQLLRPSLTELALKAMGESGRAFRPMLYNTVNATMVRGGEKINVAPSEVTLELDARLLPGVTSDEFLNELREVTGNEVEFKIARFDSGPGQLDMRLFDTLAGILTDLDAKAIPVPLLLSGATDARFFASLGIMSYGFVPMKLPAELQVMDSIHAADERIPIEALHFGTEALFRLIQQYRGPA